MQKLMSLCLRGNLFSLCLAVISTQAAAEQEVIMPTSNSRPFWVQENILRTAPNDDASFVVIVKPTGGTPAVEVLTQHGEWEEVRLRYRFRYNGSDKPSVCKMSLFDKTFSGFRKVPRSTP